MNKNRDWKSIQRWTEHDEDLFDCLDVLFGILLVMIVVILFYLIAVNRVEHNDLYAPRDISNYAISPDMAKFMHNEGHGELFGEYDID